MASFTVQVVDDEQSGVGSARVALSFTSPIRGMTAEEYTDSDGYAYFDGYEEGEVQVFVDGASCGDYSYRDGDIITITR